MRNYSVIVATNAEFFADIFREKLHDAGLRVFTAGSEKALKEKIKIIIPNFLFLENCFSGYGTDDFINRLAKRYVSMKIVVWTVTDLKPQAAASSIMAGAESFFSLRNDGGAIETIIARITSGRQYRPADVEAALEKTSEHLLFNKDFTGKEREVIKLVFSGKSNKEIGEALSVTVHAVKFHKANIYRKCRGNKSVDIFRDGIKRGIINFDDF